MKDLLPAEVYNRKDKIGFAIPHNSFNTDKVKEYFRELITNAKDENFLDKKYLLEHTFQILIKKIWIGSSGNLLPLFYGIARLFKKQGN